MNNEIIIEAASATDYEDWLPLWKKYQQFYNVDISDAVTERTWQRFFSPLEPVFCVVAKHNGAVVGFAHYLFHRSTWADSDYCYLEDLYVCETLRGKQIGKQLIEYVQKEARKRHSSHLYWHTHEANYRGQRLYDWVAKKSGMIEYRMQVR
ncbi:GNAT family N-acetyltransferase [Yokenella regensburgei]|uniref:GNAT family N-acetyltransferase n=1 Tax=Yokenella regensburgei TaxID=158877 RepID=UPI003F14E21D